MRPLIGITLSEETAQNKVFLTNYYFEVVEKLGGIPLLLPPIENMEMISQLAGLINGLILSGGGDVDPLYINQEPNPHLGVITPKRDYFELELTRRVLARNIPILAICRGMQLLNIAAGGTIYQDINTQLGNIIKHTQDAPKWHPTHKVTVKEQSLLFAILQAKVVRVNSFHHQAVAKPAPDFCISASSSDGIIEAIESTKQNFVFGVQWHPECMWERDTKAMRIFQAFMDFTKKSQSLVKK